MLDTTVWLMMKSSSKAGYGKSCQTRLHGAMISRILGLDRKLIIDGNYYHQAPIADLIVLTRLNCRPPRLK